MTDERSRKLANLKVEDFVQSLFGDIFGCFSLAAKLNIEFPSDIEEYRCVPDDFFSELLDFSKPFINSLFVRISHLPALLYASDDFFKRFAYSVCLKLSTGEEDELTSFLKVTVFLVALTATSFANSCYRILDEIPIVYRRILEDHLRTRFYLQDQFGDAVLKCHELGLDETWTSKTVNSIRRFMDEGCTAELPLTKVSPESFQESVRNLKILDMRKKPKQADSDIAKCKFCGTDCVIFVRVFFQPRIKYKPDCPMM